MALQLILCPAGGGLGGGAGLRDWTKRKAHQGKFAAVFAVKYNKHFRAASQGDIKVSLAILVWVEKRTFVCDSFI